MNQNEFLDEYDSSALLSHSSDEDVKSNGVVNHKVTYQEFLADLSANSLANLQIRWEDVETKIHESIAKLFYAVAPSLTSFQDGRSSARDLCAVYGVDVPVERHLRTTSYWSQSHANVWQWEVFFWCFTHCIWAWTESVWKVRTSPRCPLGKTEAICDCVRGQGNCI